MSVAIVVASLIPTWASTYSLGLDVSHWQGAINWAKVAKSRHIFVYQKATEGTSYTDPTYQKNRQGAVANGIKFGAYHFSNPQGSTGKAAVAEAKQEADHFVAFAQPAAGDLIPALDLENSHYTQAMPTKRLIKWVDAWLLEVETKVGVKPDIYTSPYFWKTKLNDSRHFADEGYRLWIAHWTSAGQPSVPAQDWGGNHWTFWQWTDCAKVPGIGGCVDEDRYGSSDLTPVLIPGGVPTPTPSPTVTLIKPASTSPPSISGDTTVGSTLTASNGTWIGSDPKSYSYAWYRCDQSGQGCSGITGGTGPSYALTADDYGHTMEVTVTATNGAGSSSATSAVTATVTDTSPPLAPAMEAPLKVTVASKAHLTWSDSDPDARSFDLRRRVAHYYGDFGGYSDLAAGSAQTDASVPVSEGSTYCFSVLAHDEAGNASPWSTDACTVAPVDDRGLTESKGWNRRPDSQAYMRTLTTTTRRGANLHLRAIKTTWIALVAQKCPGCGRARVLLNGEAIKLVKLNAATIKDHAIIPVATFGQITTGKLEIKVLSHDRPVRIDGVAVFRAP
ncbi:MAG: GH25 family lysozyme [Actinomycetota bacterium]